MIDKVNILGITYDIQYVDGLIDKENIYGEINYHKQVIRIEKSMNDDRKVRTIMHEITHGIIESLGYIEINENEEKIQNISNALYLLLENNNRLFSLFGLR